MLATVEERETEHLRVLGQNPFQGITTKTRLRQLLQTHQGRDKLFKVAQYLLRIKLWWNSVEFNVNYLPGEEFSRLEQNLMTIVNSRRLFRLGRFFGEVVRMRVTLIKASELVYIPISGGQWVALFIQCQMILDLVARTLLFIKSFNEDIALLVQKGFFHSQVAGKLIHIATRCGLPVLLIDLFLNTLRLYQGLLDASASVEVDDMFSFSKESFSLLSKYDRVDKLRRKLTTTNNNNNNNNNNNHAGRLSGSSRTPKDKTTPDLPHARREGVSSTTMHSPHVPVPGTTAAATGVLAAQEGGARRQDGRERDEEDSVVLVDSYSKLLWTDFELHWVCVTETKLLLDIFVATSNLRGWKGMQGPVSVAGFFSGLCSVYRVWTYGR